MQLPRSLAESLRRTTALTRSRRLVTKALSHTGVLHPTAKRAWNSANPTLTVNVAAEPTVHDRVSWPSVSTHSDVDTYEATPLTTHADYAEMLSWCGSACLSTEPQTHKGVKRHQVLTPLATFGIDPLGLSQLLQFLLHGSLRHESRSPLLA
jgi:hypothetical protein